ncbi:MAG: anthranilate synthase component I [Gemmatimonadales bacterium]|nr:anthranilate synthase component I [Gemmatimonadales bacterium]NIN09793.1 anthranilate synthase component I [Gemmatimonadales bacterium]NIN48775.1 anthranilate synthase component I [Gemmatimonadales bacterium]NIP06239.1 anthranilate synthase component I [Gemmatimonadales bacterium]NIR02660.1 anthranilate synthase component I [Gemmatimonadales bacterium]
MTAHTSFERYRELARPGGVVPVVHELSADVLTPITAFAALAKPPFSFLLESLVGGERWARYTFLGTEPAEAWRYHGGEVNRWTPAGGWQPEGAAPDPLAHLAARLRSLRPVSVPGLPRFTGGAVGYLSYDVARTFERLPGGPTDDLGLPDALFVVTDALVIIDNAFARAMLVANTHVAPNAHRRELSREYDRARARISTMLDRLRKPPSLAPLALDGGVERVPESPYPREAFERDVRRIKRFIRAGDALQIVLSRRQDVPCAAAPLDVYRSLRMLNPAPYLYYLALDGLHLAGSSPEVLVRVEDGEITVRPIAGTRPRGTSPDDDTRLAKELLADEKELAEHAMLVDLGRNDVGRVAQYGSVRVTADKEIERYSHVQHIVSEVRGQLRGDHDAVDALRACFPAGTVSGAPKVRAMQILDELEPTRRGPYAGAVGYIGWGAANLDTAIAIRTAILHRGRAHVQAGAGIVADSNPAREYEETESKAGAVLRALALAPVN